MYKHLTVCKQMTYVKSNCPCYIAILETIYCVQTNELWLV